MVETWIKAAGSATQAVNATAASATVLDFSAETADRLNEFDLTTNTATITTSGIYLVIATVKKNTGAAGSWGAALIARGTVSGMTTLANVDGTANNADAPTISGTAAIYLSAGEQVTIEIFRGASSPAFNATSPTVAIVKLSN